jgi:ribose-phosphate pyrophosphokinase
MIETNFHYKSFIFPCGERHIQILDIEDMPSNETVIWEFEKNEELIELLLIANALREMGGKLRYLDLPYVPFSRQDRVNGLGECFSLKVFCHQINLLRIEKVRIMDPHSDVTPALLHNCEVTPQEQIFEKYFHGMDIFNLVSPDGGALKKIYKLASIVKPLRVIECSKIRNTATGEITGVKANCDMLGKQPCFIVDDICDGGRTFIEIAKVLKEKGAGKIVLMVTHGFFTKGLEVFDGLIDEIYTRKGRVK